MNLTDNGWIFQRIVVGELMVNCYLIGCAETKQVAVIDPGDDADVILRRIGEGGFTICAIINTHGHGDHIGGNGELKNRSEVPLLIGAGDAPMLTDPWANLSAHFGPPVLSPPADRHLKEGDIVAIGNRHLKVIETPGHSPGGITLVGEGFAVCGDLIFQGSIGRTDFPGGDLEQLLKMVRDKIYPLGDDCVLYPGHGPETIVGDEKRHNLFLQPGFSF